MDWIMEFRFMIYLFSELLLRIHRAPRPAQVLGCKGGRDPVRWQGVHCLRAEVDQRGMVEEAGEVGGFLEEAASKLSLEGYVGICWKKGEGRRDEYSVISLQTNVHSLLGWRMLRGKTPTHC